VSVVVEGTTIPTTGSSHAPAKLSELGSVYATFIEEELKDERARRDRLEARGSGILTSSATLVTLLAAAGALVLGRDQIDLPGYAVKAIIGAVSGFGLAGVFGLAACWPFAYGKTQVKDLTEIRREHWNDEPSDARHKVTYLKVMEIEKLRSANNKRLYFLVAGLAAQLSAAVLLIFAVGSLVASHGLR